MADERGGRRPPPIVHHLDGQRLNMGRRRRPSQCRRFGQPENVRPAMIKFNIIVIFLCVAVGPINFLTERKETMWTIRMMCKRLVNGLELREKECEFSEVVEEGGILAMKNITDKVTTILLQDLRISEMSVCVLEIRRYLPLPHLYYYSPAQTCCNTPYR